MPRPVLPRTAMHRPSRSGLGGVLLFASALLLGCGDDVAPGADMSALTTCTEMCTRFLTCTQTANPAFMGSAAALVPCENTCFAATEQVRADLRLCFERSCGEFMTCAATAGWKLAQKPAPDAGMDLGTTD